MTLGYFIYIVSASSVIINWLQKINLRCLDALICWESSTEILHKILPPKIHSSPFSVIAPLSCLFLFQMGPDGDICTEHYEQQVKTVGWDYQHQYPSVYLHILTS